MSRFILARIALFGLSTIIATAWIDQLLRITEETSEFLVSRDELEALAEASEPLTERIESEVAGHADLAETNARELRDLETAQDDDSIPQKVVDPQTEPDSQTETTDLASEDDRVRQFQAFSGNLTSFEGNGSTAAPNDNSGAGSHSQPTWNVTLVGTPTIGELSQLQNAKLTAVRQVGQSSDIVVVSEASLSQPTDVKAFLAKHPNFRSGEGIILDRRMLDAIRDRLLPYGMGWKLWLLIDDKLFRGWVADVTRTLVSESKTWEQVDSVSGSLRVDRRTQQPSFRLHGIAYKPASSETSTSNAAQKPGGN